jgi:ParB family chromosome partitioning protein
MSTKAKFNTSGLSSLLKTAGQLENIVKESPQQAVRDLTTMVVMLPIDQIKANKEQPRKFFDSTALDELAESIRVHGIIQPITVRRIHEKEYQIISGERRYQAAQLADLKEMPAYVRIANDQELLEMALIENVQREDLNAWEIAVSYSRLKEEFKLTDASLAERVGKKRETVTNYLRLLILAGDDDIKKGLIEGRISMGHARPLAALKDYAFRNSLYHKIVNDGMSVRKVEEIAKDYQENKKSDKTTAKEKIPSHLMEINDRFNAFFGTKVGFKRDDSGKGQVVIKFSNDSELNKLLDAIEK